MTEENCPKNEIKLSQEEVKERLSEGTPLAIEYGPHEFEILFKTTGRAPESRSGSAVRHVFISQCRHCMKIKAEFPEI